MGIYRSKGTLTGVIEQGENLRLAQEYLQSDDMTQYLEGDLKVAVERIQWYLDVDGHSYYVEAITRVPLSAEQLKELASWVSGQNSDGLGEGFEQQPFAEKHDGECGECYACESNEPCENDYTGMISFDWKTNKSEFTQA
jgi:L-rhamnose isomerase